jgi:hypothetical protein
MLYSSICRQFLDMKIAGVSECVILLNGLLKSNHLAARRLNYMIFTIIILKIYITLQLDLTEDKNTEVKIL